MFQLIETICYENGFFQRVSLHESRLNTSRMQLFGLTSRISLLPFLQIPEHLKNQKVKCRITYCDQIENIEYEPYIPKKIRNLKIVFDDHIDYQHKLKDRTSIDRLSDLRGDTDEILIVKNGMVTDTSFANILFFKEKTGEWYTPITPLLSGTRRAQYIQQKLIIPYPINVDELHLYNQAKIINAMLSIEDTEPISIDAIFR